MKYEMTISSLVVAAILGLFSVGCGGGAEQKQNKDFFTSGDREADQRADQRMAKAEQLKGGGEGAGDKSLKAEDKKSLFERLGGDKGITLIVEDFTPRVLDDPRVNFSRKGVKQGGFSIHRGRSVAWTASPEQIEQLKKHFVQFISLATGGPSHYDGLEMKEAHSGLHITNAEFDASIGDLKASLDKVQVPNKEQKELLSIIESTRTQIAEER